MTKKSWYILTFTVFIFCIFSFIFFRNNGLDSIEYSILSSDKIKCLINGKVIDFSIEKLQEEVDIYINNFTRKEFNNPDSIFKEYQNFKSSKSDESYLTILSNEINTYNILQFSSSRFDLEKQSQNFKLAKFRFEGYINGVELIIYADLNKNVTCLELKSNNSYYHSMDERFLFLNDEIISISRHYMIGKSVGLNGENAQYNTEQEIFKFANNSLFEIVSNIKGEVEKNRNISDTKAKRYLSVSLLLRKIANNIIQQAEFNCLNKIAYLEDGSDELITSYFNNNFKTDTFFKVNNEKYIYRNRIGLSIDSVGKVDKLLINPFDRIGGFEGNKEFHERITKEIARLLYLTTWNPKIENCKRVPSIKEIHVTYNFIVKDNKLDLNSKEKGKFKVYQELDSY